MDADVVRQRLIELANRCLHNEQAQEHVPAAIELAEAVHDLDEWLRSGGVLPRAWAQEADQRGRKQDVDISVHAPTPRKMVDDDRPLKAAGAICGHDDGVLVCTLDRGHEGDHL